MYIYLTSFFPRFRNITTERIEEISVENDYNLVECILRLEDTPPDPVYFNEVPRTDEEIKKYINDGEDDFLYEVSMNHHFFFNVIAIYCYQVLVKWQHL